MGDFSQIIKSALEYYDNNEMKNYDKIKKFKYYQIFNKEGRIIFLDDKKKKILETNYEVIGKYIYGDGIWIWGWSVAELDKKIINTSKKVLNYALELDHPEMAMKSELITSRSRINSPIQIDIHVALTSFLSKQQNVFHFDYYGDTEDIVKIHQKKDPESSYYLILEKI